MNSTQMSLLSTNTTEPDLVAQEVRYKLIDIVNLAIAKAAVGTLSKSTGSPRSSRQSGEASANANLGSSTSSTHSLRQESPPEIEQDGAPGSTMSASVEPTLKFNRRRQMKYFLSEMKRRWKARMSKFHDGYTTNISDSHRQEKMSARQFEKSPSTDAARTSVDPVADRLLVEPPSRLVYGSRLTPTDGTGTTRPTKLAEVATFIASLDSTVLDAMNDEERKSWMRKSYTEYKAHNRRSKSQLALSPIVENSVVSELPAQFNRGSEDVRYAGGLFSGIEDISYRHSTSSETSFDALSFFDDSIVSNPAATAHGSTPQSHLYRLRRGINTQRPQSMPNSTSIPRYLHQRGRGSFDSRSYRGNGSTLSLRAQPASPRSQGSMTLNESNISLCQTLSGTTVLPDGGSRQGADSADPLPSSVGTRDFSAAQMPHPTARENSH
ncbi:hypothetical protein ACEQ8H_004086 [Pleosporales sp. CAS-2024a]